MAEPGKAAGADQDKHQTIVMIHGMCCGAWCWDGYRRFFERRGYSCLAPDLRHHEVDPKAPPPAGLGTTSLTDYVADLEQFLAGLAEPPIIMGHSMGGLLAQQLAAKGLAKKLVLLAPAPSAGINVLKCTVIRSFCGLFRQWRFWARPFRLSFNAAVYAPMQLLAPRDQKAICRRLVYESGRVVSEVGLWFLDPTGASRVDAARVTCPVLVVAGSKDRMTPAAVIRRIHKQYRSVASYQEFDRHGHWLIGEPGWETIAEFVCDWLSGGRPGTAGD